MQPHPTPPPAGETTARPAVAPQSPAESLDTRMPDPRIERCTCHSLYVYEIGAAIDLEQAQQRVTDPASRESLPHRRRAPEYFEFQPPPLRVTEMGEPFVLDRFATSAVVNCVFFDFGAVEVMYTIDIAGPMANLAALSNALSGNAAMQADARRRVEHLIQRLGPAVN